VIGNSCPFSRVSPKTEGTYERAATQSASRRSRSLPVPRSPHRARYRLLRFAHDLTRARKVPGNASGTGRAQDFPLHHTFLTICKNGINPCATNGAITFAVEMRFPRWFEICLALALFLMGFRQSPSPVADDGTASMAQRHWMQCLLLARAEQHISRFMSADGGNPDAGPWSSPPALVTLAVL
jgi:hypothetical protein